jgi:hypothetical protein
MKPPEKLPKGTCAPVPLDSDVEEMVVRLSAQLGWPLGRTVNALLRCTIGGEFVMEVEMAKPARLGTEEGRKLVQSAPARARFRL